MYTDDNYNEVFEQEHPETYYLYEVEGVKFACQQDAEKHAREMTTIDNDVCVMRAEYLSSTNECVGEEGVVSYVFDEDLNKVVEE